jgi:hypothetical protein
MNAKNGWGNWHPELIETNMVGSGTPHSPSPLQIAGESKN